MSRFLKLFQRRYGAESYELDLGADDLKVDLSFLKPLTAYEVRLIAVNDIGKSNAHSIVLNTSGKFLNFPAFGSTL